ncbi:hypothetical protein [Acetobacter orleanensis]|uniref:Uncharacterized protein n=1 Tax=Acetobacter orleanensis TaxID=104099 RepID=A0A4Y3TPJ4_9PROT|nr:hypothetical protein [Acetobacter orleanensis]KXV65997.1 hypothetical protein AD949_03405 [Acetobacter orleanensis]PCD78515.1 hypothetical protein CO710_11925 [Acetobacter orleanensis]GAN69586.1 hypothetical protein Abol_047_021 [Acetobacter orleanensis JCM 7639]GBR28769.1 hypothetical protein AA0473_1839 [Acetobacter orleanensis NRIC 0473]GEB83694.1 hypothetical protein AOR01nite_21710 [Acetobacter orleanensis]
MSAESIVKLKLSVWRDFAPGRPLSLWKGDQNGQQVISSDSEIQQEIFSWQMREDPFDGVLEQEDRARLRAGLLDRFEPSRKPSDRRVERLDEFVSEVDRILNGGRAEWTISLDPPREDEDAPYRLNSLLALRNQIEWLIGSFGGIPGLSVSVR